MSLIKDNEAANRLARAIASDIALYNEDKIKKGIVEDNLFEVLNEEIEEGRKHYQSKVDPEILQSSNYFEKALVDVLIRREGHLQSRIW
ncbi:MAG TPA: hypothetical protein PKC21_04530 [Oligoflexia bacterium]|nr:hypothetical protein [Oligoflexia bacterium]HMR24604.1 hypothetical protein [Oligoflexia bacterium]